MSKMYWYPRYWSTKKPVLESRMVSRYNEVRSGAGTKGSKIGYLGTGSKIVIDKLEDDAGWVRIVSVDGHKPIPHAWVDELEEKGVPETEMEWWIDKTALQEPTEEGEDLVLQIVIHPDRSYEVRKM